MNAIGTEEGRIFNFVCQSLLEWCLLRMLWSWIVSKFDGRVLTWFIWKMIRISGDCYMTRDPVSGLSEEILISQAGLCSVESVTYTCYAISLPWWLVVPSCTKYLCGAYSRMLHEHKTNECSQDKRLIPLMVHWPVDNWDSVNNYFKSACFPCRSVPLFNFEDQIELHVTITRWMRFSTRSTRLTFILTARLLVEWALTEASSVVNINCWTERIYATKTTMLF
jgi:hypothetical protein